MVRTRPVSYPSHRTAPRSEGLGCSWCLSGLRSRSKDKSIMSNHPKASVSLSAMNRLSALMRFIALVLLSAHANGHRQHESWITLSQPNRGAPIEVIHRAHLGDIVRLLDHWSLPDQSLDNLETLARLTLYAADRLTVTHAEEVGFRSNPLAPRFRTTISLST